MNEKIFKFRCPELARSFSAETVKMSAVMLGDDDRFWVVTMAQAAKLEKAGYEYAN